MINHRIFLLIPIDQEHDIIIIWADDENSARNHANHGSLWSDKRIKTEAINIEDIKYYTNESNASCRELEISRDYQVRSGRNDGVLEIQFMNKVFRLNKYKQETVDYGDFSKHD